jgi:lipoate synthase
MTININDLRKIIKEEIYDLSEAVDHAGIRDVVNGASKLLAAVEAFKETAPHSAINAVTPHINQLEKTLEDMVSSPGSYVAKQKAEPKKVSLKAIKHQ